MFNLVDVETGIVVRSFDNGADASTYMREENARFTAAGLTKRYRIVKQDWQARELARFTSGQYVPTPWHGELCDIVEHYCHVAIKDGARLAYTPSEEHGKADRQVVIDAEKYLRQYYKDEEWIDQMLREFRYRNEPKLLFARTPDEIEDVYVNSEIPSCMSHDVSWYSSDVHPVRVYGSGDFSLAYLRNADNEISARGLVCEDRKIFARLYGESDHLSRALRDAGFRKGTSPDDWHGLRLLRIKQNGGFVAPYLDAPMCSVTDNGKYLVIDEDGELTCGNTNGLIENGFHCACCDDDNCQGTEYNVGNETWCEVCYENYACWCSYCEGSYHCDDMAGDNRHGEAICNDCARRYYTRCDNCEILEEDNHIVETIEHNHYCRSCAEDLEVTTCGEYADDASHCECNACETERNEQAINEGENA